MKKCKIIGYGKVTTKETKEEMLRIVIGIPSISDKYIGTMTTVVFLEYSKQLEEELQEAIEKNLEVYYQTSDNIISGTTKITKLELRPSMIYESHDDEDF